MRKMRTKAAICVESLEGRQLQTVLNPQPLPPIGQAEVHLALNPQPLPPIGTVFHSTLNPQPLPPIGAVFHSTLNPQPLPPSIHPIR
jgi:hypothetical protein